jgi:predicted dehydrogenase
MAVARHNPEMRTMNSYRAAVIGHTGRGGYVHSLDVCFAGMPNVEVVAVADPDEAGRRAAQARIGAARAYAGYREMLERERPDVVSIAPMWLDQREAMVVAAAEAGVKAINCEKPLAQSLDQADRMLAACDTRGVKLAVAHQNRGFPAPWFVRDLIAQGKIGRLRAMRGWPKQDARGGALEHLVHGTHVFDLMRLFAGSQESLGRREAQGRRVQAGEARWCHARVTQDGRDATPDDVVDDAMYAVGLIAGDDMTVTVGFDNGVTGTWESMRSDDGGGTRYLRMEVSGTGGTLAFWSGLNSPVYYCPRPFPLPDQPAEWERLELEAPPVPDGFSTLHAGNQVLVGDLLAAVEQDRPPLSSGHDARAALEIILAAYESHARQARITLPLADRTHPLGRWKTATATGATRS